MSNVSCDVSFSPIVRSVLVLSPHGDRSHPLRSPIPVLFPPPHYWGFHRRRPGGIVKKGTEGTEGTHGAGLYGIENLQRELYETVNRAVSIMRVIRDGSLSSVPISSLAVEGLIVCHGVQ